MTDDDVYAERALTTARRALAQHRYVDAYRLAIRADALRLPILYQVGPGTVRLDPLPLTVTSAGGLDVDVTAHRVGRELRFTAHTRAATSDLRSPHS